MTLARGVNGRRPDHGDGRALASRTAADEPCAEEPNSTETWNSRALLCSSCGVKQVLIDTGTLSTSASSERAREIREKGADVMSAKRSYPAPVQEGRG